LGKVFKEFHTSDSRRVVLRTPRMSDLDDFLEFINSLVDEGAEILVEQKLTREAEADWLGKHLADIEKGVVIGVAGEVDGKIVANSEVRRGIGKRSHVGTLGIAIRDGYRDLGIGTKIMQVLIEESKKAGLQLLRLTVFDSNLRAKHVYKKVGFREVGKIPRAIRHQDRYVDEVVMVLPLQQT
jgi:RimJ/RimL family protein N-acetyltransferase